MTTATLDNLAKARIAKAQADVKRREQYAADLIAFREWLRAESLAYAALITARQAHGATSIQAHDAKIWHQHLWATQPTAPPDHAWSR